ncbi:MAG TPA: hypothetical protein VN228_04840 [Pyrinomonadaceae bacterium]|nr:hypothetical protein [Pyrinomonadaceae bacterium]
MCKILILIVGLTFSAVLAGAGAVAPQAGVTGRPCSVRKIYVADFGADPRHVNFRLFLEKWLSKKKFTVARKPEDADAVLTGALTISGGDKRSELAFKGAELKSAGGERAWRGDFYFNTGNAFGWLGRGHIENGAKKIAEDVRAACK